MAKREKKRLAFTAAAKAYLTGWLETWPREDLAAAIEGQGGAAYDDEPIEDLIGSVLDSMETGDIHYDTSLAFARSLDRGLYMLWLDISDWWE